MLTEEEDNARHEYRFAKPVGHFTVFRWAGSPKERPTIEDIAARRTMNSQRCRKAKSPSRRHCLRRVSRSIGSNPRVHSQSRSRAYRWSRVTNQISIKLRNAFRGEHAGEGRRPFATFTGSFSRRDLSALRSTRVSVCSHSHAATRSAGSDGLHGGFTRLLSRTLRLTILPPENLILNVTI